MLKTQLHLPALGTDGIRMGCRPLLVANSCSQVSQHELKRHQLKQQRQAQLTVCSAVTTGVFDGCISEVSYGIGGTALDLIGAVDAGNVGTSSALLLHDIAAADFSINPAMLILPTAAILAG